MANQLKMANTQAILACPFGQPHPQLFRPHQRLRRVLGFPNVRQELLKVVFRRLADLGQHAGQIALRIDAVARCRMRSSAWWR